MKGPNGNAPDDTEIAAEYVLRVLTPEAHRAAAARAAGDPVFAAEIRAWEDRLVPLMDTVEEVTPDPASKTALMRSLFGHEPVAAAPAGTRIWQLLAGLGLAAATALAVIAFVPDVQDPAAPAGRFVAELAVADESTRMFAVIQPAQGTVDIAWTARNQPDDRELQLWALVDGQTPVSIAVLPRGRTATLALPPELASLPEGLVLAISDEPLGGSPTGAPTGAVVATATLSEI